MSLSIHTRALLQGIVAGAVALAGATACSRDRADAGRDTTQVGDASPAVTPADTQASATTPPATPETTAPAARDTAVARVETATPAPSNPSPDEPQDTASAPTAGQDVSGYQAMGHAAEDTSDTASAEMANAAVDTVAKADTAADTVTVVGDSSSVDKPGPRAKEDTLAQKADSLGKHHEADRIRPPEDSAETLGQVTTPDTSTAGYEPMVRDTSVALAQGDAVEQAASDTALQAATDTAAIQVQVDTTTAPTELAVEDQGDSVTVVGDSSSVDQPGPRAKEDTVAQKADSLAKYHGAEHARAPEDSTEAPNYDVEAVGDADADAVGAAQVESTGNIATGADAVALITRVGQPCRVEDTRNAQWDLAGSPATLNPCGTGTMTLPKVQTGDEE